MEVQYGSPDIIEPWMEIVKSVRSVFPGLETEEALADHRKTVLRFMRENRALCVMEAEHPIGILLLSKKHNMICCLAISKAYRGKGIGSALLQKAISDLDRTRPITVTTFREDDENGLAPRALYKKYGFQERDLLVEYGYPLQRFVLPEDV